MYIVLDRNLQRVGMLSLSGARDAAPFFNDVVTMQIADDDSDLTTDDVKDTTNTTGEHTNTKNWNHTLDSISIPYGNSVVSHIVQGSHLMYQDPSNNHWYVMRLQEISDPTPHVMKTAIGVNLAIWDLGRKVTEAHSIKQASSTEAFTDLLADTGWIIGDNSYTGGRFDIDFDIGNRQDMLQTLCQTYDCEIDAYVLLNSAGQIVEKRIDIVDKLGEQNKRIVRYGQDLVDITRTSTDANLYTRLYVYDKNGNSIESVNNGAKFVEDASANDLYSSQLNKIEGAKFLEGNVTSPGILNKSALLSWGKGLLKKFNHPRVNYQITLRSDFTANLGDEIRIQDYEMDPEATVESRVIRKSLSFSDPTQNQIIVGEFATVKVVASALIDRLQSLANRALNLIEQIKDGKKAASVHLVTPTGANWTMAEDSKTVIAKVFVDSVNLTTYLSNAAFIWQKTDPITGLHDTDWEEKHVNDGSQLSLEDGDVGTVTCKIDGSFLKNEPEIVNKENYTKVWSYNFKNSNNDPWGEGIYKAPQYVHIDEENGFMIFSSAYDNDAASTKQRGATADTKYHRFTLAGKYMDSMVLQGGGHGSSFGYRFVDGMPEIWTTIQTKSAGDFLGHVKYQPNTVVKLGDKSVINMCKLKNFKRISVDFEHGWVLAVSASNGLVEIVSMDSINSGKWEPAYSFNVSDFDFKQWKGDYKEGTHELQSNDIFFPYIFLNAGHFNNKDERLSICINVVTESLVFRHTDSPKMLPDNLIVDPITDSSMPFEPETIGYYSNGGAPYLLQGFDYHRYNDDGSNSSLATLWKTDLTMRDDSEDITDETPSTDDDSDTDEEEGES